MNSESSSTSIFEKLVAFLPLLEKVFLSALATGLVLKYANIDSTVMNVAFVGLGVTFFFSAFRPIDVPMKEYEVFGMKELLGYVIMPKILWIGCAVLTIGIFFTTLNTKGAKHMLYVGSTTVAIAIVIIGFLATSGAKHIRVLSPVLLRAIPLLFFRFIPFFQLTVSGDRVKSSVRGKKLIVEL